MSNVIENLQSIDEYWQSRPHIFPSRYSFNWFFRQHREQLKTAGAILKPTSRWLVVPAVFDDQLLAIGRKASA